VPNIEVMNNESEGIWKEGRLIRSTENIVITTDFLAEIRYENFPNTNLSLS
jgi:hypothetical protein